MPWYLLGAPSGSDIEPEGRHQAGMSFWGLPGRIIRVAIRVEDDAGNWRELELTGGGICGAFPPPGRTWGDPPALHERICVDVASSADHVRVGFEKHLQSEDLHLYQVHVPETPESGNARGEPLTNSEQIRNDDT